MSRIGHRDLPPQGPLLPESSKPPEGTAQIGGKFFGASRPGKPPLPVPPKGKESLAQPTTEKIAAKKTSETVKAFVKEVLSAIKDKFRNVRHKLSGKDLSTTLQESAHSLKTPAELYADIRKSQEKLKILGETKTQLEKQIQEKKSSRPLPVPGAPKSLQSKVNEEINSLSQKAKILDLNMKALTKDIESIQALIKKRLESDTDKVLKKTAQLATGKKLDQEGNVIEQKGPLPFALLQSALQSHSASGKNEQRAATALLQELYDLSMQPSDPTLNSKLITSAHNLAASSWFHNIVKHNPDQGSALVTIFSVLAPRDPQHFKDWEKLRDNLRGGVLAESKFVLDVETILSSIPKPTLQKTAPSEKKPTVSAAPKRALPSPEVEQLFSQIKRLAAPSSERKEGPQPSASTLVQTLYSLSTSITSPEHKERLLQAAFNLAKTPGFHELATISDSEQSIKLVWTVDSFLPRTSQNYATWNQFLESLPEGSDCAILTSGIVRSIPKPPSQGAVGTAKKPIPTSLSQDTEPPSGRVQVVKKPVFMAPTSFKALLEEQQTLNNLLASTSSPEETLLSRVTNFEEKCLEYGSELMDRAAKSEDEATKKALHQQIATLLGGVSGKTRGKLYGKMLEVTKEGDVETLKQLFKEANVRTLLTIAMDPKALLQEKNRSPSQKDFLQETAQSAYISISSYASREQTLKVILDLVMSATPEQAENCSNFVKKWTLVNTTPPLAAAERETLLHVAKELAVRTHNSDIVEEITSPKIPLPPSIPIDGPKGSLRQFIKMATTGEQVGPEFERVAKNIATDLRALSTSKFLSISPGAIPSSKQAKDVLRPLIAFGNNVTDSVADFILESETPAEAHKACVLLLKIAKISRENGDLASTAAVAQALSKIPVLRLLYEDTNKLSPESCYLGPAFDSDFKSLLSLTSMTNDIEIDAYWKLTAALLENNSPTIPLPVQSIGKLEKMGEEKSLISAGILPVHLPKMGKIVETMMKQQEMVRKTTPEKPWPLTTDIGTEIERPKINPKEREDGAYTQSYRLRPKMTTLKSDLPLKGLLSSLKQSTAKLATMCTKETVEKATKDLNAALQQPHTREMDPLFEAAKTEFEKTAVDLGKKLVFTEQPELLADILQGLSSKGRQEIASNLFTKSKETRDRLEPAFRQANIRKILSVAMDPMIQKQEVMRESEKEDKKTIEAIARYAHLSISAYASADEVLAFVAQFAKTANQAQAKTCTEFLVKYSTVNKKQLSNDQKVTLLQIANSLSEIARSKTPIINISKALQIPLPYTPTSGEVGSADKIIREAISKKDYAKAKDVANELLSVSAQAFLEFSPKDASPSSVNESFGPLARHTAATTKFFTDLIATSSELGRLQRGITLSARYKAEVVKIEEEVQKKLDQMPEQEILGMKPEIYAQELEKNPEELKKLVAKEKSRKINAEVATRTKELRQTMLQKTKTPEEIETMKKEAMVGIQAASLFSLRVAEESKEKNDLATASAIAFALSTGPISQLLSTTIGKKEGFDRRLNNLCSSIVDDSPTGTVYKPYEESLLGKGRPVIPCVKYAMAEAALFAEKEHGAKESRAADIPPVLVKTGEILEPMMLAQQLVQGNVPKMIEHRRTDIQQQLERYVPDSPDFEPRLLELRNLLR